MKKFYYLLLGLSLLMPQLANAQDDEMDNDDLDVPGLQGNNGFHFGFNLGAYFANRSTASLYDGYGFDVNGDKNTFENSFLYRKIVLENGGMNGTQDNIALQLKVNHEDWTFDKTDMPNSVRYKPAFLLGIHLNYGFRKRESIIFNLNFARINAEASFTIGTIPPAGSNQLYPSVHTFPLRGSENRTMMQLGYSHIFGNNKYIDFFAEGGLSINFAKLQKYFGQVNDLRLDLTTFNYQNGFTNYEPQHYSGWGFGAFAGAGVYVRVSSKYTAKVLYSPSYEKINLGLAPSAHAQHSVLVRIYYTI